MQQVALTRGGQTTATDFDHLAGPHLEAGYRTAFALLRDPTEAEDALQEAAFKAWRRSAQLRQAAARDARAGGRSSASPMSTDRARLAYSYLQRPTLLYLVRLSDGAILMKTEYDPGRLADITASPDGTLFAESSNQSTGYLLGGTAPNTLIKRTVDGAVVATLDPSIGILAFSADNSVALVNTSPWASGVPTQLALMRVSDGSILWRYSGGEEYAGSWIQPNGSSIAVMLQSANAQDIHATVELTSSTPTVRPPPCRGNTSAPDRLP